MSAVATIGAMVTMMAVVDTVAVTVVMCLRSGCEQEHRATGEQQTGNDVFHNKLLLLMLADRLAARV